MKKIIHFIILFIIVIGITGCSPKEPSQTLPTTNPPASAKLPAPAEKPVTGIATLCASENGKWLREYQECEGVGSEWCKTNGGEFNECASACRHNPKAELCTMQCVLVCSFITKETEQPVKSPLPRNSAMNTIRNRNIPPIVGGDRDEHGCIGSAGYQWCENKQKCLRIWEEDCDPKLSRAIQQLFADKYKKPLSEIKVTIAQSSEQHVRGSVLFGQAGQGEGGNFLAAKTDGVWKLVFDGNGGVACKDLEEYQFPKEMIQDICAK